MRCRQSPHTPAIARRPGLLAAAAVTASLAAGAASLPAAADPAMETTYFCTLGDTSVAVDFRLQVIDSPDPVVTGATLAVDLVTGVPELDPEFLDPALVVIERTTVVAPLPTNGIASITSVGLVGGSGWDAANSSATAQAGSVIAVISTLPGVTLATFEPPAVRLHAVAGAVGEILWPVPQSITPEMTAPAVVTVACTPSDRDEILGTTAVIPVPPTTPSTPTTGTTPDSGPDTTTRPTDPPPLVVPRFTA